MLLWIISEQIYMRSPILTFIIGKKCNFQVWVKNVENFVYNSLDSKLIYFLIIFFHVSKHFVNLNNRISSSWTRWLIIIFIFMWSSSLLMRLFTHRELVLLDWFFLQSKSKNWYKDCWSCIHSNLTATISISSSSLKRFIRKVI